MKDYYNRSGLAPYLQGPLTDRHSSTGHDKDELDSHAADGASVAQSSGGGGGGEADVAAGSSMLQRVSSFNLLGAGSTLRLSARKAKEQGGPSSPEQRPTPSSLPPPSPPLSSTVVPTWRLKDRMKTVGVGLVMALNVGTDPPDVTKPHPCAKLQCWLDPKSVSRAKAKEQIGERLEAQYAKWQQQRAAKPLKYRRAMDPTVDDVRSLCVWLRRQARNERILLHYNGHGVPRPTANGEIWVFDKNHTQYIPLSVTDLRQWMGKPSIVVLDCSGASVLMPFLTTPLGDAATPPSTPPTNGSFVKNNSSGTPRSATSLEGMDKAAAQWVRDVIVLCPTSDQEWLPMHPEYPADIFTSCLTTPIQIALRWFVRRNPQSMGGLSPDAVDAIPGKANDRKTPLGELNWIFTAVTDAIAWNTLPKPLFSRLFRQDLLVASMFRNFLLADRILRSLNCTPQSYPPMPPGICDHPLWQAWDLACETCLFGLIQDGILGNHVLTPTGASVAANKDGVTPQTTPASSPRMAPQPHPSLAQHQPTTSVLPTARPASSVSSPFFSEQLTAFEIWLEFASMHKSTPGRTGLDMMEPCEWPEQLPVVLQVLLSQSHRIRALVLLRRFLDLGPWAVNLALSLGVFPYVMKLLQSPEYKHVLIGIWAKILAFDPSCQADLVKDGALPHFIHHLSWGLSASTELARNYADEAEQRTMAAFILSVTCLGYAQGQNECLRQNLHGTCCALLSSMEFGENPELDPDFNAKRAMVEKSVPPSFRMWLCICLGNSVKDNNAAQSEAYGSGVHRRLFARVSDDYPDVRAAACYALGCLLYSSDQDQPGQDMNLDQGSGRETTGSVARSSGRTTGLHVLSGSSRQHGLIPSHLAVGATGQTMSVPTSVAAGNTAMPGRMQPTFGPTNAGVPNLQWQPHQQLHEGMLRPQPIPHGQPLPMQPSPYSPSMQDRSMIGGSPVEPRLVGRLQGERLVQGQSPVLSPSYKHIPSSTLHQAPSVFDDRIRLDLDLSVMDVLVKAAEDASPMVRYEATMSLACAVGKFLPAFTAVAEERAGSPHQTVRKTSAETDLPPEETDMGTADSNAQKSQIRLPPGVDQVSAEQFASAWKTLRLLQHNDLHPAVSSEANTVVSVVHEHILSIKMRLSERAETEREEQSSSRRRKSATLSPAVGLMIDENDPASSESTEFGIGGPLTSVPGGIPACSSDGRMEHLLESPGQANNAVHNPLHRATKSQDVDAQVPLRRIASEYMTGWRPGSDSLERSSSGIDTSTPSISHGRIDTVGTSPGHQAQFKIEYVLPKSKFYEWKRETCCQNGEQLFEDEVEVDLLSPEGAVKAYRDHRNAKMHEMSSSLAQRYESLAPKPQRPKKHSFDADFLFDDTDATAAEEEATSKKRELEMRQSALLSNNGVEMTSMLRFHPYEEALVVGDGGDGIIVWNLKNSKRASTFRNGNPKGSRMTSASWINDMTTSLFLVGSDDGAVRIWDGLIECNGEVSSQHPELSSAFFAAPDKVAGTRGSSGLITEWQQFSGKLIAGGNSRWLRCWDLGVEQCIMTQETNSEAYITTLTTAWEYKPSDTISAEGYHGIGPDIIVAGCSDGCMKVFDIRSKHQSAEMSKTEASPRRSRRRGKLMQYAEHSSWIVDTAFTSFGGRYEIVSGSVAGDLKVWDLRVSSSLRTLEVQRSPMTALAIHSAIPMVASGSHAQFLKILTLDGDTLQVIRYHEKNPGHRIGPVSCLEFHPHKPLLAAGATDETVSLYSPKRPIK